MAVLYEIGKKALCHELNEHKFFITFDASAQKKMYRKENFAFFFASNSPFEEKNFSSRFSVRGINDPYLYDCRTRITSENSLQN